MTDVPAFNEYDQPIGPALPNWTPRMPPPRTSIQGRYCRLAPMDVERHARELYEAYATAPDGRDWTYMSGGPFPTFDSYYAYATRMAASADPLHHVVVDGETDKAVGTLALMRVDTANGVIEVGHVAYSPLLKRTRAGTEAQYLLMRRAFDELGYRRYEWKCDALNAPSRRAAARYGFTFEGVFRQAIVYRGRSRDTAWFSITDGEWPAVSRGFEQWLSPENFDAQGRQRATLAALIAAARA
ncbi:GNAT family N-acetyltransferase [Pandoraea nosoerga]|uniref:GNAT family N-acetyltransferase n=1 Tax=Pandoraea nosoerga TaxID=2508296 RepID=A0A5E4TZ29_9BURK|nr:GNAT family protein [Pandoraea nosoerga]MBN4666620.1 GNAT family N-acetyltransferase [Pandoraea nosoerga]MBN4676795.1 GNAT family N-acetyltransferase [Pandoraea nosoerga]MBN4682607.1 GNAT family N-acetyltransferase [Pandoraea nosoerga]MBN4745795.1 GNAT family N-acetyltransferase [Pandoraea nosoerga]VVD92831.1 GNAT family N-acetyltransferase [Pandoraea nosoerga]